MWLLILLHAIFASTFTFGKIGLAYAQPIFFVASRAILSGVVFLSFYLLAQPKFVIKRKDIGLFIQLIFFQIYFAFVLEFAVIRYINSAKWALIYAVAPFIAALFSYFYFDERLTIKKIIGLCIGLIGLFFTLITHIPQENIWGQLWGFSFPEIAILLSVISYSYSWIVSRRLIRDRHYPISMVNAIAMIFGGILALITSPLIDTWSPSPIIEFEPFIGVLLCIVAGSVITVSINTFLLKRYTATFLLFLSFVDPLYVALYGWLFLSEMVTWHFFVSVFFIFLGLFLFYQEDLRQGYVLGKKA